eukprot:scaffold353_cov185-Amphora_coffeaeformis.AAC.48
MQRTLIFFGTVCYGNTTTAFQDGKSIKRNSINCRLLLNDLGWRQMDGSVLDGCDLTRSGYYDGKEGEQHKSYLQELIHQQKWTHTLQKM